MIKFFLIFLSLELILINTIQATLIDPTDICSFGEKGTECYPMSASGLRIAVIDYAAPNTPGDPLSSSLMKFGEYCQGDINALGGWSSPCWDKKLSTIITKNKFCFIHGNDKDKLTEESYNHRWGLAIYSEYDDYGGFAAGLSHSNVYLNPFGLMKGPFFLNFGNITVIPPQYSFKLTDEIKLNTRTSLVWDRNLGDYTNRVFALEIQKKEPCISENNPKGCGKFHPIPMVHLADMKFDQSELDSGWTNFKATEQ